MAIKVGVLGAAKKVKRIYVGVNGRARRVILARAGADDGSNKVCYADTTATVLSSVFFPTGNVLALCWCTYNGSTRTYTAAFSSYVNPNAPVYSLTEISRGSDSSTIQYTGRALSLGSSSKSYQHPKVSNVHSLPSIADYVFSGLSLSASIGGTVVYSVELRKVSPYSMSIQQSDTDTGALAISIGTASRLGNSSQSISQNWSDAPWPSDSAKGIVTVSSFGTQQCIVANADGSKKIFPYEAHPRTSGYVSSNNLRVLVTDPDDGAIKLVGIEVYKIIDTTISAVKGRTLIVAANEYTDTFFGESYVPTHDKAYRTVCYTSPDASKRVCKLVCDTTGGSTFNITEITEYSEEFALDDNENSRASSYTWQILGTKHPSGSVYILSTVRDRLKIIILEHVDGGFSKKAELDLGKDLSDSVEVKDVVPSARLEDAEYINQGIFVPAVLLSHNNGEYYELIIARVNES